MHQVRHGAVPEPAGANVVPDVPGGQAPGSYGASPVHKVPPWLHIAGSGQRAVWARPHALADALADAGAHIKANSGADARTDARTHVPTDACAYARADARAEHPFALAQLRSHRADASSNSGAYSGAKRGSVICTESSFDTGS